MLRDFKYIISLALVLTAFSSTLVKAEQDTSALAADYLSAYPYSNPEKLAHYLSDEATWIDPTFGYELTRGKENILELLKSFDESAISSEFTPELLFASNEYAVFKFTFSAQYKGEVFESQADRITVENMEGIAVVRFNDAGKVIEHVDYANAESYYSQVEQQK